MGAGFCDPLRRACDGGLSLGARPAEAAPFLYVTILGPPSNVTVIDTATNKVVTTIPGVNLPGGSRSLRMGRTSTSRIATTPFR
jgi:YVTN family beta-propeller protein